MTGTLNNLTYFSAERSRDDRSRRRFSVDKGSSRSSKPSSVIGVFGLDLKADERDLYSIFCEFGNIEDIQIVYDNLTGNAKFLYNVIIGRSRGFAFVYFKTTDDAVRAVKECERGLNILGKTVRVDFSKTCKPHEPTPGIYMGHDKTSRFRGFSRNRGRSPSGRRRPPPRGRSPRFRRYDDRRSPRRGSRGGRYGGSRRRSFSRSRSRSPQPY